MQYVALLTQQQFEAYQKGFNKVDRIPAASPVVLTSDTDEEKLYLVRDMDGKEYPEEASGSVERYSPLIAKESINLPKVFHHRVKNAENTDADDSMIQYWKDNKSKYAKIDLSKETCQCPSCGKTVRSSDFDGAHVVIVGKGDEQYITPTCKTCNRSRVERVFEVYVNDLVKAPK